MADVLSILAMFGIPLTIGGIIGMFIQTIIVTIVIIIASKMIAHELEGKHAFVMALVAYFVTPLMFLGLAMIDITLDPLLVLYVIPLLIWIGLGELLLKGETKSKLMIAIVAFIIYLVIGIFGIPAMIASLIPL